ncbi:hypothetical protein [Chthoniobacter flavus]|nr:hypothetical protein [Chthoniobacter flavus]
MVSSVLAAPTSILGSLFSPSLADSLLPAGIATAGIVMIILAIVVSIPVTILVTAIPMWLSAKIAVSGRTTYGMAIKVIISRILAGIVILGVGVLLMFLIAAVGGKNTAPLVVGGIYAALMLVAVVTNLLIIAGTYDIGTIHAFGVQLLSGVISMVLGAVLFFSGVALFGKDSTGGLLQAAVQKIHDVQANGLAKALPAFNSPTTSAAPASETAALPPPSADYSAEIDNLLNAALHPDGPRPSLAERENIVRSLQEKLRVQKASLPAGDAHAMLVFQNQLNRYMALLETVQLERRLHPLRDEVVTQKPIGRDYASPAQK